MQLPKIQSRSKELMLLQTKWISILNPVLALPTNDSSILTSVSLKPGSNTINHGLGRKLQGWSIVRQRASASIYDNQDNNQMPELTLVLVASAPVVVDIEVF
jgi:hypothetical protein